MSAQAVLQELEQLGCTVAAEGDRLTVSPSSRLTDELRARIRECKPEILAELQPGDTPPGDFSERRTGRQIIEPLLERHECPDGCGPLELQDRARDVWFCPDCRLWVTEGRIH